MSVLHGISALAQIWTTVPSLPIPVTNNAVAAGLENGTAVVYSFLGLDSTKLWSGISNRAFRWKLGTPGWEEIQPVPGPGRLAGTAQALGGKVYLFGGYTVAEDGTERSVPSVDVYDPSSATWSLGSPMPVPVDDAVSAVWRDSLIYLVSGWHDTDNVANVQVYDPAIDSWWQATPIPGRPVFGHTGGLTGNTIIYIDGVARNSENRRFEMEPTSWRGEIDPSDPTSIAWIRLPDHPSHSVYRAAAAAVGDMIVFAGGTDNPYNYDGIGYDGVPAEPSTGVFGFDVLTRNWRSLPALSTPSMDHRGIVVAGEMLVIVGGMTAGQRVTTQVVYATVDGLVGR